MAASSRWTSGTGLIGLTGTATPPAPSTARYETTKYQLLAAMIATRSPGSSPRPTQTAAQAGSPAPAARRRSWTRPGEITATASSGWGSMIVARFTAGSPAQRRCLAPSRTRTARPQGGTGIIPIIMGMSESAAWMPVLIAPCLLLAGRGRRPPRSRSRPAPPPPRRVVADAGHGVRSSSAAINSLRASQGPQPAPGVRRPRGHGPALDRPDGRRRSDLPQPEPGQRDRRALDEDRRERRRRLRRRPA